MTADDSSPTVAREDARESVKPVAVILSRFPVVTQTFILRELVELERQGSPLLLVSLLRGLDPVVHPLARPWAERALYPPALSLSVLRENLRILLRAPRRVLRVLGRLLWEMRSRPGDLVATLAIFPRSVWLGRRLRDVGVRHLHAQFAAHAATAAYISSEVYAAPDRRLPYSITIHAYDIFLDQTGLALKLGAASFVRSISEFNVRFLEDRLGARAPGPDRYRVIHCGIEPHRYAERRRDALAPGQPTRLLSIASLRPFKGVTYLIEAVRRLREEGLDVTCEVIGEGSLRSELETQIERADLRGAMSLLGNLPEEEVTCALTRADLFVLPSIVAPDGNMEGIPISLMEAMASGLPVVSTRTSGIPELVIDGETGRLVEPADPVALARVIRELIEDPGAGLRLAEAGRRRVGEEFALERSVSRLRDEIDAHSLASE